MRKSALGLQGKVTHRQGPSYSGYYGVVPELSPGAVTVFLLLGWRQSQYVANGKGERSQRCGAELSSAAHLTTV